MNPILARFQHEPSLVAPQSRMWFESCIMQTAAAIGQLSEPAAGDPFWLDAGDPMARFRPYVVSEGVLTIPVLGALLNGFPWQWGTMATGYEYIWQAFRRGMADERVRGIALLIDSPGGMVAGNFDLTDRMAALRGTKPVAAFAHECAYSAAYNIAAAADTITVSRTGGVGSVGVVTVHVDESKALLAEGIKVTFIHAGRHKVDGNSFEPLPDAVRDRIQERIDALYDVFVASVARNRGLEEAAVRATEAQTFTASEALSNGLADAIGPLEDSLAAFAASLNPKGDESMAQETADLEVMRAAAREDGLREGASAERARITAILASDQAKVRPRAALAAALKSDMTVEQAVAFLADLPEEALKPASATQTERAGAGAPEGMFKAAMSGSQNPDLGAGDGDEIDRMSVADRIFATAGRK